MAKLTEIELEVLAEIADIIEGKIRILELGSTDKDKLAYLTCLNEEEKIKYTRKEIPKLQKEFHKCSAEVSPYVFALIEEHPSDKDEDYYVKEKRIISNFILSDFHEVFELFAKDPKDLENWYQYFDQVIIEMGFDSELLSEFVVYMHKGSRYIGLTSFLPENNIPTLQPKKESTVEAVAKPILPIPVTSLVEKTENLDIEIIRAEIAALTDSSKKAKDIDKAAETLKNKYLKEFKYLSDEIIENLDTLKRQSQEAYLTAFRNTYDTISKINYDSKFNDSFSTADTFYEIRTKDPGIYALVIICNTLGTKIFKPLANALIIDRSKDFCTAYNLPANFSDLKKYIKNGFYEIERFMDGNEREVNYFNIPRAVEKFNSVRFLFENNPKECFKLLDKYCGIIQNFAYIMDKSEFANQHAFDSKIFTTIYNEVDTFSGNMQDLFSQEEIDEMEPEPAKVLDIFKNIESEEKQEKFSESISSKETFDSILTKEKQVFILTMLEDLGITVNGIAKLSERRKGAIRGVVEALKENNVLPNKSLEILNNIIANAIGLELKSKLDYSNTSNDFHKKANKYILEKYNK